MLKEDKVLLGKRLICSEMYPVRNCQRVQRVSKIHFI